jgi:hypothetical protein
MNFLKRTAFIFSKYFNQKKLFLNLSKKKRGPLSISAKKTVVYSFFLLKRSQQ